MDQNSHPNTPDRLADALTAEGFVCDPGGQTPDRLFTDYWEVADENLNVVARVASTDDSGAADVYAFTGGRAMLLAWEAQFSDATPVAVIAATAKAAAAPTLSRYMHAEATS